MPAFDLAPPLDFGLGAGTGIKTIALAFALAFVAAQPPYAAMVWRMVRRAVRNRRPRSPSTLDTGVPYVAALLIAIGAGAAIGLRTAFPMVIAVPLAAVLTVLALLDLRYFWLPDRLTLPLGVLGVAAAVPDVVLALEAVIAAAVAGCAFTALHVGYRLLRGVDGLGLGDVKLVAALGAWVGLAALPWLVLLAALTALTVAGAAALTVRMAGRYTSMAEARSPFGLHLALAGWVFICLRQSTVGHP